MGSLLCSVCVTSRAGQGGHGAANAHLQAGTELEKGFSALALNFYLLQYSGCCVGHPSVKPPPALPCAGVMPVLVQIPQSCPYPCQIPPRRCPLACSQPWGHMGASSRCSQNPLPAMPTLPFPMGRWEGKRSHLGPGAGGCCSAPAAQAGGQAKGSAPPVGAGCWCERPNAADRRGKIKFELKAHVRSWAEKRSGLLRDSKYNIFSQ